MNYSVYFFMDRKNHAIRVNVGNGSSNIHGECRMQSRMKRSMNRKNGRCSMNTRKQVGPNGTSLLESPGKYYSIRTPECAIIMASISMLKSEIGNCMSNPWCIHIPSVIVNVGTIARTGVKPLLKMRYASSIWKCTKYTPSM